VAREINGAALGAIAVGSLFLYSGLTGKGLLDALRGIVKGEPPSTLAQALPISSGGNTGSVSPAAPTPDTSGEDLPSGGSVQQILNNAAKKYGWHTGAEWQSLQTIEVHEAGYNPKAHNASGAFGIAQALGHGNANTRGTIENQYGGYGLTDAEARLANSGDPRPQAKWMIEYIKQRWGDPNNAWAGYHARGNWY
jgi:hypothetical protein